MFVDRQIYRLNELIEIICCRLASSSSIHITIAIAIAVAIVNCQYTWWFVKYITLHFFLFKRRQRLQPTLLIVEFICIYQMHIEMIAKWIAFSNNIYLTFFGGKVLIDLPTFWTICALDILTFGGDKKLLQITIGDARMANDERILMTIEMSYRLRNFQKH